MTGCVSYEESPASEKSASRWPLKPGRRGADLTAVMRTRVPSKDLTSHLFIDAVFLLYL